MELFLNFLFCVCVCLFICVCVVVMWRPEDKFVQSFCHFPLSGFQRLNYKACSISAFSCHLPSPNVIVYMYHYVSITVCNKISSGLKDLEFE